jgi:hypothetical protein
MARLLISRSNHLLLENPADFGPLAGVYGGSVIPDCLELLLSNVFPPYSERPLPERVKNFFQFGIGIPETYPLWLGHGSLDEECLTVLSEVEARTLLGYIANACGRRWTIEGASRWTDLLRTAVKAGAVDRAYQSGESVLFSFIRGLGGSWSYDLLSTNLHWSCLRLNKAVHGWLEVLVDVGIDLAQMGTREYDLFLEHRRELSIRFYRYPELRDVRVVGLSSGQSTDTWRIWLSNPLDGWAGDFWQLVEEGPSLSVPGAWVDDEEENAAELRAEPGQFRSLVTSRRKRRRYLRFMGVTDSQMKESLGSSWEYILSINANFGSTTRWSDLKCKIYKGWPQVGEPVALDDKTIWVYADSGDVYDFTVEEFYLEYCKDKAEERKRARTRRHRGKE